MRKFNQMLLAVVALILGTTSLNAQNRYVLKNSKDSQKVINHSNNMVAIQIDDEMAAFVSRPKVKSQVKGSLPTHTLNFYPPTQSMSNRWQVMGVSDGDNLLGWIYNGDADYLSLELEEGSYYLLCWGKVSMVNCIWIKDNLMLNADTDINVNFDECVYNINANLFDENNNPFNDGMELEDITYYTYFSWMGNTDIYFTQYPSQQVFTEQVPRMRFNGFDEHSSIDLRLSIYPGLQKSYYIQCPLITNMCETVTVSNTADELKHVQERFSLNQKNDTLCFYHTDIKMVGGGTGGYAMIMTDRFPNVVFNPDEPYDIFTNVKIYDPLNHNTILLPTVSEWYNGAVYSVYSDYVGTALYFDSEGNVVREASPFFRDGPDLANWPNYIPETPARTTQPANKLTYFGERTPLATYYPAAYNANNSAYGMTFFYGGFFFSGEHSCERSCDYDSFIRVCLDDVEVYNDSICNFNYFGNTFPLDAPANVKIDVLNNHLVANNILKSNSTHVEFNLEKDDAMPPTMTFVRVLDGNGDENIWHDCLNQSCIVFACGDYNYHFDEEFGAYDHLEYNTKPQVELLYSIDGDNWELLDFTENENLFNVDYGNVFITDLGQLDGIVNNQWVNLKFVVTDEAGNSQVQELSNVFYVGQQTSVNEATTLTHTVYPNPFTNEVRINAAESVNGSASISVFNVLGEQVISKAIQCNGTTEFVIDGSSLMSGIYFYSIATENGKLQGRIVKE